MNQNQTVKMYPGMSFDYYIPDDLLNAVTETADGKGELDKTELPCFKIKVLGHKAWVEMQDIGNKIDECREGALNGDPSQSVAASQIQRQLVAAHVTGCDNFPKTGENTDEAFNIEKVLEKDLLSPRHIAYLAAAILSQKSNDDIELDIKKKLDSQSDSATEDADPENAPDPEAVETSQTQKNI